MTIGNQRTPLARLRARQRDRRQLAKQRQLRQLQGVVAIGLALDVLPSPRLAVGVRDLDRHVQRLAKILHPARRGADFDHDTVRLQVHDQVVHRRRRGPQRLESVIFGRSVRAGHALELPQVDGENQRHVGSPCAGSVLGRSTRSARYTQDDDPNPGPPPGDPAFIVSFPPLSPFPPP